MRYLIIAILLANCTPQDLADKSIETKVPEREIHPAAALANHIYELGFNKYADECRPGKSSWRSLEQDIEYVERTGDFEGVPLYTPLGRMRQCLEGQMIICQNFHKDLPWDQITMYAPCDPTTGLSIEDGLK